MRFSSVIFAGFIAVAAAQDIPSGLSDCVLGCLPSNFGSCEEFDYKCICSDVAFINQLSCCVKKNCNKQDQQGAVDVANGICGPQGVDVPQTPTCGSEPTPTSSSASQSESGSNAEPSASPTGGAAQLGGSALGAGAAIVGMVALL